MNLETFIENIEFTNEEFKKHNYNAIRLCITNSINYRTRLKYLCLNILPVELQTDGSYSVMMMDMSKFNFEMLSFKRKNRKLEMKIFDKMNAKKDEIVDLFLQNKIDELKILALNLA